MGYHQCRWGYQAESDFTALKDDFQKFDIPVSALWYDIDYMDEYRVFTWDRTDFPAPAELNNTLKEAGIRTVTIIDPGVKLESGYPVYDGGKEQDVFCKTASGRDYVGSVWPGDTVFPDFTLETVRDWWADQVAGFLRKSAIDGVWLDMNDPSTGFSIAEDMRFENGEVAHDRYHNQYANFMARASLKGFDRIDPQARPFLLTRSAFTGIQRYSAVWTGDNASNWRHLRMSIPCTINLGLSGVAFNGPDVGGFMGHTTPELLVRWYQAGFLFPFFRNHTMLNSKAQEPWQFGTECLAYVRETIKTRYRLLPYLYNCFFEHYLTGDPILRPLMYEYQGREFENLDDQFLIGSQIMIAPILHGEEQGREIVTRGARCQLRSITFPPGWWFDLNRDEWVEGAKTIRYAAGLDEVPLFIRDGSIIPYYPGPLRNSLMDLKALELHIFSREQPASLSYFIDDRQTRRYQTGDYNTVQIDARIGDRQIQVNISEKGNHQTGTVEFAPVLYGRQGEWRAVTVVNGRSKTANLNPWMREWVCKTIEVLIPQD
jgi:alpha-glucosidase